MTFFKSNQQNAAPNQPAFNNLFCVAIGSSAGSFEALKEFFGNLSATASNCAIILGNPLEEIQFTALQSILEPNLVFGITRSTNGTSLRPGMVYAVMPGETIKIVEGKICLQNIHAGMDSLVADSLFQSVAIYASDKSIAVVLSGTGNDGSAGVKSIKAAGGKVLVQMPQTAKYDGMPKAAICTCCIDEILSPADIGKTIGCITTQHTLSLRDEILTGSDHSVLPIAAMQTAKVVVMSVPLVSLETMIKETLYEGYQHAFIVIDKACNIKEVNGDATLFINMGNRPLPCNLFIVLNESLKEEVQTAVDNAITNGLVTSGNLEIIELAGKIIFIRIIVKPIENAMGIAEHFVVIFENMNPKKFIARGVSITDKLMAGTAMQQLAAHIQTDRKNY